MSGGGWAVRAGRGGLGRWRRARDGRRGVGGRRLSEGVTRLNFSVMPHDPGCLQRGSSSKLTPAETLAGQLRKWRPKPAAEFGHSQEDSSSHGLSGRGGVHEHAFWCSIVLTRRATEEGRRQRAGHWQSASARKEGGGEGWSGCRLAFRATCWNIPMPLVGVQATSGSIDALNFCQTTAGITGLTPQSSISISIKNFIQHQH